MPLGSRVVASVHINCGQARPENTESGNQFNVFSDILYFYYLPQSKRNMQVFLFEERLNNSTKLSYRNNN